MATAQAQAGLNRTTAITQAQLSQVHQVTPYGNLAGRYARRKATPDRKLWMGAGP